MNKLNLKTHKATNIDCTAITKLTSELGYSCNILEISNRLDKILKREDCVVYVAEDENNSIVGWIQIQVTPILELGLSAEIIGLIVAENARRKGVGSILVQSATKWATSQSAEVIFVRSNIKRIESNLFYPSLGFLSTKTQHVYQKKIV
ncbi:MAG: hypothetical protein A2381_00170 [Bdellovibrionales bacterium RIFOXYB1_FULL_37_110]|nr:MAG: hypothetical protein A2417_11225 [Bdellovibrionales bacterium RIFOXYC1_FULL_37_79]OFZ60810.1 MAG: hypothetical protein A2381_00170 [Bdellovibrionales bacterium RIFOXYB1_FULL_37_110]OFZ62340.1 MAG: hypothetical protein A2577_02835 [Bdellovibrionales bacterium RIFOXYD1_FULL_36_51]